MAPRQRALLFSPLSRSRLSRADPAPLFCYSAANTWFGSGGCRPSSVAVYPLGGCVVGGGGVARSRPSVTTTPPPPPATQAGTPSGTSGSIFRRSLSGAAAPPPSLPFLVLHLPSSLSPSHLALPSGWRPPARAPWARAGLGEATPPARAPKQRPRSPSSCATARASIWSAWRPTGGCCPVLLPRAPWCAADAACPAQQLHVSRHGAAGVRHRR